MNTMIPVRYFSGLSSAKKTQRKKEIFARSKLSWKNPAAYKPFATDKNIKTKKSKYIREWQKKFPNEKGLNKYSKATGVPLSLIRKSYNRGMAAWRTGHRPGATQQQWGYARAASMLLCGKTHYTTDADIVTKAKKTSKGKSWFKKTCRNSQVKYQR
jgi:hypothetical protein